jgi:hypothetical protein
MSFLAPALLAALAAIAIPIVVHLVQRDRRRVVQFPSLMFLRKIPNQSVKRRAIRHWPLLLLRIAAFALHEVHHDRDGDRREGREQRRRQERHHRTRLMRSRVAR